MNQTLPKHRPKTQDKIMSFLELQEGWHYGDGAPPSLKVVDYALKIVNQADFNDIKTNAFPGVYGEILVTLYHGDVCYEFTIENNLSIDFVEEKNGEDVRDAEGLKLAQALTIINDLGEGGWANTSEASKKTITTRTENDLQALLSAFQATAAYQIGRAHV